MEELEEDILETYVPPIRFATCWSKLSKITYSSEEDRLIFLLEDAGLRLWQDVLPCNVKYILDEYVAFKDINAKWSYNADTHELRCVSN